LTAAGSPAIGSQVPSELATDLYAAKLTWRLSNNHTLWGSTNGEPSTRAGYIFSINGPPSSWQGTLKRGAPNVSLHYDGVFGSSLLVRGVVGRDHEITTYGGAGASIPAFQDSTVTPRQDSGGFGAYMNQNFKRTVYKGDVTKFWGAHEIKAGADYEDVVAGIQVFDGGAGQTVRQLTRGGVVYYRHRYLVNDRAPGFDQNDPSTWAIADPLVASPADHNMSLYLQDSFKVRSNLSINYGLRWERQLGLDRDGNSAYDMKRNWAPRIGVVWDPTSAARAKVFASYGRYYDNLPLDLNIRQFSGFVECLCFNFSPSPSVTAPDPAVASRVGPGASSLLGSAGVEPTDAAWKGMYSDEWTGGVELELPTMQHTSVGAKLIRRSLGRAIEDFMTPDGNFLIGNPAEGTFGLTMASFSGESVPAPKPVRKDTSVELSLRKRYNNNWQFLASYVWTNLVGNYDGQYQVSSGQLDPGSNAAYDVADFMVNSYGHLSSERKHQVKLDGSYTLNGRILNGLTMGASFHWFSGLPLTAYGYQASPYSSWEYFLTPRGSLGRGPSDYEADVQVLYPLKLRPGVHADLQLAIFNVLNRQAATQLYQHYNEAADGQCAGIPGNLCNGDNGIAHVPGTITPVGQLDNPAATATSPDFLKAGVAFTGPRSARIGVRLTF
jgi:hypothetical protein